MKRLVVIALLLVAAAVPASAQARTRGASAYQARVVACTSSLNAYKRHFRVDGVIRKIPRARRVGLRFDLLVRYSGQRHFSRLAADGFGTWQLSDPGYGGLIVRKDVNNLRAPADYRMRVSFRWYGRNGRILAQRQRVTATCHQRDLRPDLRVTSVTLAPRSQGHYVAVVRNAGLSAAGAFDVQLQSGGTAVPDQNRTVGGLAPGRSVTLPFDGPPCAAGAPPTVVVDPDNRVAERDEQNNARSAACS